MTEHRTAPANADIAASLSDLLGPQGWTQDAVTLEPWLTDWRGRYTGRALGMASPASTGDVAAIVRHCSEAGVPIVAQGGNSGMVGGATPDETGSAVLLSLRRMTTIEVDSEARTALCDAGAILQTLHERSAEYGLRFPLSLGGKGSATIGGLTSTNAGGTQVLRHGVMRSLILGLEAVCADGSVYSGMTDLKKDNRGFDLKQLFIGSEGTLGIVTKVLVRLVPQVSDRIVGWAGLPDPVQARHLMLRLQDKVGDVLEGFEILPQGCLDAVLDYIPGSRAPLSGGHGWHALFECVLSDDDDGAAQQAIEEVLARAMEDGIVEDAVIAANETQAEAFWALRENIAPAEKAKGPAVQHDISVAPADMPGFLNELGGEVETTFEGHRVRAFGHLGDGNIHFHVLAPVDADEDWTRTNAKKVSSFVYDRVTQVGGSISAEHGIGQDKIGELARTHDDAALNLMRAVKRALDPQDILNPGKLVPLAPVPPSP